MSAVKEKGWPLQPFQAGPCDGETYSGHSCRKPQSVAVQLMNRVLHEAGVRSARILLTTQSREFSVSLS